MISNLWVSFYTSLDQCWSLIEQQQTTINQLEAQSAQLQATLLQQQTQLSEKQMQIDELLERIGKSSRNASRPPSSDSPAHKAQRPKKPPSSRQQGAQPGHSKHERALLPEAEMDEVQAYWPPSHCQCGSALLMDAQPRHRHQVFDLPVVKYTATEHQIHQGHCPQCHQRYVAQLPDWVPSGQMGPRLISTIVWLSGQLHCSIRQIQQVLKQQWQLDFSIGAISQAQGKANAWLGELYRHIGQEIRRSPVAHADETRYYRGTERRWLWALVTDSMCWLMTHYSRGMGAADELLQDFSGYLVTDHYAGYGRVESDRRQLCWAHLMRQFQAISERCGLAGQQGQHLLLMARCVIRVRHYYENHRVNKTVYHKRMQRLKQHFSKTLTQAAASPEGQRTTNQCRHLLKDEALCWTFLRDDRIPLTNNTAERALRPYVIWRKLSFACQSYRGEQFFPMVLSVIGTLQRLQLPTAHYLRTACTEYMTLGHVVTQIPVEKSHLPQPP